MAPGIAGAPDADTNGINFGLALKKGNRAPPIGDLLPRVDIPALCPIAGPEMAMIMDQHDKTGFRETPCKSFQAVLLHTGIAVRHRNRRGGTFGAGNEEPTAQVTPPSTPNSIFFLSAIAICLSPLRDRMPRV